MDYAFLPLERLGLLTSSHIIVAHRRLVKSVRFSEGVDRSQVTLAISLSILSFIFLAVYETYRWVLSIKKPPTFIVFIVSMGVLAYIVQDWRR